MLLLCHVVVVVAVNNSGSLDLVLLAIHEPGVEAIDAAGDEFNRNFTYSREPVFKGGK